MNGVRTSYPRLALPCTVIADGELVHLIAGEDVRYSLRAGACALSLAALLLRCDGSHSLDALLLEISEADRAGSHQIVERLYGERLLIDGPVEQLAVANRYRLAVEGRGELAERLLIPRAATNEPGERGGVSPSVDSPQDRGADATPLACLIRDRAE